MGIHTDRITRLRGFALVDLVIAVASIGLTAVLVTPAIGTMRTNAGLTGSQNNLRQMGEANAAYSSANNGFLAGFDWEAEPGNGGFDSPPARQFDIGCGDISEPDDNLEAAQSQLAAILRKATGRCGNLSADEKILPLNTRLPSRRFTHIPLLDWMGASFTDPLITSPLDTNLQDFQRYTTTDQYHLLPGGDAGFASDGWTNTRVVRMWPYTSSYRTTAYAWSPSRPDSNGNLSIEPADGDLILLRDPNALRPQHLGSVTFPSLKTHYFEEYDFSQGLGVEGRDFRDPLSSVNILAFDGSVQRIATADANPGWDPANFRDMSRSVRMQLQPIDTRYHREYPAEQTFAGPHYWTRGGLEGIDFGAGEINTSGW